jgi:hypothetical protein
MPLPNLPSTSGYKLDPNTGKWVPDIPVEGPGMGAPPPGMATSPGGYGPPAQFGGAGGESPTIGGIRPPVENPMPGGVPVRNPNPPPPGPPAQTSGNMATPPPIEPLPPPHNDERMPTTPPVMPKGGGGGMVGIGTPMPGYGDQTDSAGPAGPKQSPRIEAIRRLRTSQIMR